MTQVICRMSLQDILVDAVGPEILSNKSKVVDFTQESNKVCTVCLSHLMKIPNNLKSFCLNFQVIVTLADGRQYDGDVLIGADGIWSEVGHFYLFIPSVYL